jgi:hypothetical protein
MDRREKRPMKASPKPSLDGDSWRKFAGCLQLALVGRPLLSSLFELRGGRLVAAEGPA